MITAIAIAGYLAVSAIGWYVIFQLKEELSNESRTRLLKDKVVFALLAVFCVFTFPIMAVGAIAGIVFEGWGGMVRQPKDVMLFSVSVAISAFASYLLDRKHFLFLTVVLWLPALLVCGLLLLAGKAVFGRGKRQAR